MSFMSHACHEQCFYDRLLCILFEDEKKIRDQILLFILFISTVLSQQKGLHLLQTRHDKGCQVWNLILIQ